MHADVRVNAIELTGKSTFDYVRILFSRFVMKTGPSAFVRWAISAFYEHL